MWLRLSSKLLFFSIRPYFQASWNRRHATGLLCVCLALEHVLTVSVSLFTDTQIETQAANQSQAAQPYINQTKAVGEQALDIAKQIGANYTACTKGNFLLYFTCLPTAISKAISTASSFGSSLNDIFTATLAAISQTGSSLASGFEANIKAATEQFKTIGEDLEKCIQDAANSTSPVLAPPSSWILQALYSTYSKMYQGWK
jgi:hypothetical protein